jgi:hypothetical protein
MTFITIDQNTLKEGETYFMRKYIHTGSADLQKIKIMNIVRLNDESITVRYRSGIIGLYIYRDMDLKEFIKHISIKPC